MLYSSGAMWSACRTCKTLANVKTQACTESCLAQRQLHSRQQELQQDLVACSCACKQVHADLCRDNCSLNSHSSGYAFGQCCCICPQVLLALTDAAFSGDWSRIGAITKGVPALAGSRDSVACGACLTTAAASADCLQGTCGWCVALMAPVSAAAAANEYCAAWPFLTAAAGGNPTLSKHGQRH
jgi:hypothetical protein